MPLSGNLTVITVTGTYTNPDGTGATGAVSFTPSSAVVDGTGKVIIPAHPVIVTLTSSGTLSTVLACTDNAGLSPAGWGWVISVSVSGVSGVSSRFAVLLPSSLGTTVDISALAPVPSVTPPPLSILNTPNTWTAKQTLTGSPPLQLPAGAVSGDVWTATDNSGNGAWQPASGGFSNPMTTLGDMIAGGAAGVATRVPGDTSNLRKFLREQAAAGVAQAPAWDVLQLSDIPLGAGQFNVQDAPYSAKGDGKVITDATISISSLSTLTSASAGFTSADTGKVIVVTQAGGTAHSVLATTITYVSATTVTLASPATSAVAGVGAVYGTDDSAAIQAAYDAAVAYAEAHLIQAAEVYHPPAYYMVARAPVTGGLTLGNSQLTLAAVTASTGNHVVLVLTGVTDVTAGPEHWLQTTQTAPGSVLVCASTSGTYSATYGPSCMIGGPVSGYGGGGGTFSNMQLVVDGLTCLVPYTTTIGGLNLYGLGQAYVKSFSVMPMAVVPSGSPWPQISNGGPPDNQYPAGLIMPATGNNDMADIGRYTCFGQYIGWSGADHLNWQVIRTIFCNVGWLPAVPSGNQAHAASGVSWSCEETTSPIACIEGAVTWAGYQLGGYASINIAALGLETFSTFIVSGDSNGRLTGVIWFEWLRNVAQSTSQPYNSSPLADHLSVQLLAIECNPGPVASPPGPPSSTAAWLNGYYHPVEVTLSVSGGTISALLVDSVAELLPAGCVLYKFAVPAGHSYTPTYTGTPTHTVKVL